MKKIKVYLQRPWKQTDSPYYLFLRENPPENVEYVNANEFKLIQSSKKLEFNNLMKRYIKKSVRFLIPWVPNAHFTKTDKKFDLIHCAHCLSLNNKPWVCDMEFVNQFWAGVKENNKTSAIKSILKRNNCKRIMPWTEWAKDAILKDFPEIKDKIEVVYPAVPEKAFKKKKSNKIRVLFSARRFYFKGGLHAVEVIDRLTKKYKNVEGIVVSATPKEVIDRYSKNKKIIFKGMVSQEELFKDIYPSCDIFLYPSYTDTFGFQILEAMSFGLPVITVEGQSRTEIIEDEITGKVVKLCKKFCEDHLKNLEDQNETINLLEMAVEKLINDPKLRKSMSKNCINEIKSGKFSIEERNRKLKRIYGGVLK